MYCQTLTMGPNCARSKNQAGSRLALPQLFRPLSSMMLHWLAASRSTPSYRWTLATRQTRGNHGCKHLADYVTAQKALYLNVQFTFSTWFSVFSGGSFHPTVTSQACCDIAMFHWRTWNVRDFVFGCFEDSRDGGVLVSKPIF